MPEEKTAAPVRSHRQKNDTKPALTDAVKVIRLLSAMSRRQGLTAEEAVTVLEKAGLPTVLRSTQRLLAGLAEDSRFPVVAIKDERPYRYRWDKKAPAWILPALSPEERAVMTAARLLAEKRLPSQLLSFFTKTGRSEAAFPLRIIEERFLPVPARVKTDIWSAVTEALQFGHYLKLRFRDNRRTMEKTVLPLFLLVKEARTVLVAREQGESKTLSVSLHHIVSAFVTSFTPPVSPSIDIDHLTDETGLNPGSGPMAKVSFLTQDQSFLSSLRETPLSPTQKILEGDDISLVTFVEHDSLLLRRWLSEKSELIDDLKFEPFGNVPKEINTLF